MQSRLLRDRLVAQWFLLLLLFHQHQLAKFRLHRTTGVWAAPGWR